jgi:16S rRNA (guanine527-N7)-methyltransferase
VPFEEELARVLPAGIPNRDRLVEKAAQHLELIASANQYMNLTRITDPRAAAIKHVYDSVAPWKHFERARCILDAGTGAGFPGIPLAIVLPNVPFVLAESVHKKAAFVDSAVEQLELKNVRVCARRAEEIALAQPVTWIVARAVAPVSRLIEVFAKPLKRGARILLYKGPDVESELAEAPRCRVCAEVLCRYELPDSFGARTLIRIQAQGR